MKEYKNIHIHKPEGGGVVWCRKVARPTLSNLWTTFLAWVTGNHIEILCAVQYAPHYPEPKVVTLLCRALPYQSGTTVVTRHHDRANIKRLPLQ